MKAIGIFFYKNDIDTIKAFIYFSVREDKTIMDQKVIITPNIKSQIILPNNIVVGYH